MPLGRLTLDRLTIDDESPFRAIGCYRDLKEILARAGHVFRVPEEAAKGGRAGKGEAATSSWDRTLFLNLTYWSATEEQSVLQDARIAADVVAHTAWHHVTMRELAKLAGDGPPSVEALFFGEAIASAFDLYLVGRLLPTAPSCDFLETQVPAMLEAAEEAGQPAADFEASLAQIAAEPERAFEDLRALLYDAGLALTACRDVDAASAVLEGLGERRFAPLLHHFQLSNWILYARAYAARPERPGLAEERAAIAALDATLRAAPNSLGWLEAHWLAPRVS